MLDNGDEEYQIIAAFTMPVYTGNDFAFYNFADAENPMGFYEYAEMSQYTTQDIQQSMEIRSSRFAPVSIHRRIEGW